MSFNTFDPLNPATVIDPFNNFNPNFASVDSDAFLAYHSGQPGAKLPRVDPLAWMYASADPPPQQRPPILQQQAPSPSPAFYSDGQWPRYVMFEGDRLMISLQEWNDCLLDDTLICEMPLGGDPIVWRREVPELESDDDSDSSSDGTATPRPRMPDLPVRPGSPMESVCSRVYSVMSEDSIRSSASHMSVDTIRSHASYMSVDTQRSSASHMSHESTPTVSTLGICTPLRRLNVSAGANGMNLGDDAEFEAEFERDADSMSTTPTDHTAYSSNLAPDANRKRKKANGPHAVETPFVRAAKRHNTMLHSASYSLKKSKFERARRKKQWEKKSREVRDEMAFQELLASFASDFESEAYHASREAEVAQMRERLAQIEYEERLDRLRQAAVEEERRRTIEAQLAARLNPEILPAEEALELWLNRIDAFKQIRRQNAMCNMRADKKPALCSNIIPCPVLFKPEYSLHLVTEENILAFWTAVLPFMTKEHFKAARSVLHDTVYRGEAWMGGEGYEDEGAHDFVISVVTRIAAITNDHIRPLFG